LENLTDTKKETYLITFKRKLFETEFYVNEVQLLKTESKEKRELG
jgi:hypothetical protein